MSLNNLGQLEKTAIEAAYIAGQEIIKIYNTSDVGIEYKSDNSPITLADKAANSAIENLLKATNIPVISEESEIPGYAIRKGWEYCWMVDPLDGTKEFIKRNGQFTVNIALIKNGTPVFGVVYAPVLGDMYYTLNNKAYMIESIDQNLGINGFWDVLMANKKQLPLKLKRENLIILASVSHPSPETEAYIGKLKAENQNVEINNIGSSLKFCMIAAGKADIYPRFVNLKEWDTAAGHAVLLAAGGAVIDTLSGKNMLYNKENLSNPWFIAKI